METYFTHFLEDARFPKAPGFSKALNKLLHYAPQSQLTVSPLPTSQCLGITQLCQLTMRLTAPPPTWLRAVKCLGPETTTMFSFA